MCVWWWWGGGGGNGVQQGGISIFSAGANMLYTSLRQVIKTKEPQTNYFYFPGIYQNKW